MNTDTKYGITSLTLMIIFLILIVFITTSTWETRYAITGWFFGFFTGITCLLTILYDPKSKYRILVEEK